MADYRKPGYRPVAILGYWIFLAIDKYLSAIGGFGYRQIFLGYLPVNSRLLDIDKYLPTIDRLLADY